MAEKVNVGIADLESERDRLKLLKNSGKHRAPRTVINGVYQTLIEIIQTAMSANITDVQIQRATWDRIYNLS